VERSVRSILEKADDPLSFTQTSEDDDDSLVRVREKQFAAAQEWLTLRNNVENAIQMRSIEIFAASLTYY
jgi:hypothetical protein